MGQAQSTNDQIKKDLQTLCSASRTLNVTLAEILETGDLTIHLGQGDYSYYDNRNINIGKEMLGNATAVKSELIMEVCNAWYDVKHCKPQMKAYDDKESYGQAVEKQEWEAVQMHIKILNELRPTEQNLGKSRFEQAFTPGENSWEDFNNYLKFQREAGHTAQIESHWSA